MSFFRGGPSNHMTVPVSMCPVFTNEHFVMFALLGYFPIIQNLGFYSHAGHGVLLITVTGSEALRIENQTNNQTLQEITIMLRDLYGQEIPDPLGKFVYKSLILLSREIVS